MGKIIKFEGELREQDVYRIREALAQARRYGRQAAQLQERDMIDDYLSVWTAWRRFRKQFSNSEPNLRGMLTEAFSDAYIYS